MSWSWQTEHSSLFINSVWNTGSPFNQHSPFPFTSTKFSSPFSVQFSSVTQSCPTLCNPMNLQHARPPCPSSTPGVHPNSCPSSRWCHPAISSSVVPFSSCPQSFPASRSFPMSQLFAWGGQSIGVSASASVLPMNTQDWSPLESWTDPTDWLDLLAIQGTLKSLLQHHSSKASMLQRSAFLTSIHDHWKNHRITLLYTWN